MAPTGSAHLSFTMAAVVAAGGAAGYAKAKSVPSLVAGLGFGAMFALGGWLINRGEGQLGHGCSLVASVLLSGSMGARFARSRKVIPSGALAVAGVATAAYEFTKYREWS